MLQTWIKIIIFNNLRLHALFKIPSRVGFVFVTNSTAVKVLIIPLVHVCKIYVILLLDENFDTDWQLYVR